MRSRFPFAAVTERQRLLRAAAHALRSDGWAEVRAAGCAEFREPQALVVPRLHAALQPDLCASHPRRPAPLLGAVATRADLADAAVARRWLAFAEWAREHRGTFVLFVAPHDEAPARAAALRWRLDPSLLRIVRPLPPRPDPNPFLVSPPT